jgi:hypothetical protein
LTPRRSSRSAEPLPSDTVQFAHASERQFARLLDFYQIEWQYEPTSFDLERDKDGNVIQRFTPDFYLPAYDMYIEITTLNQKLVTKKNRKVRRLRELYPDVRCKIFYQRDYLSLVMKYGLDDQREAG